MHLMSRRGGPAPPTRVGQDVVGGAESAVGKIAEALGLAVDLAESDQAD